jgi:hypothetical protein
MLPSASMLSGAGTYGRRGIAMVSPDSTTMKPAPAFKQTSRIGAKGHE